SIVCTFTHSACILTTSLCNRTQYHCYSLSFPTRRSSDLRRRGRSRCSGSGCRTRSEIALQLVADPGGDRIQRPVRVADVQPGDQEGHGELAEAEEDPHVQVADDLQRHEALGVGGQQHVRQVPDQERRCHRDREAAEAAAQTSELLGLLDGEELLGGGGLCCGGGLWARGRG